MTREEYQMAKDAMYNYENYNRARNVFIGRGNVSPTVRVLLDDPPNYTKTVEVPIDSELNTMILQHLHFRCGEALARFDEVVHGDSTKYDRATRILKQIDELKNALAKVSVTDSAYIRSKGSSEAQIHLDKDVKEVMQESLRKSIDQCEKEFGQL